MLERYKRWGYNDRKVRSIASNLRPEAYLLDLMATDRGAPIAVPVEHEGETYYLVLAGNNRVEALEMARNEYPSDFNLYQEELPKVLPDYGYDMTAGQDIEAPVLFRRLIDDVNLQQFADASNADTARRHTTGEQAGKDALKLSDEVLGRLNLNLQGKLSDVLQDASNVGAEGGVRLWLQSLEAEAGDMYVETTDPTDGSTRTELTQQGVRRLENALFRRVFSSPQGLRMLELFETVQNSGIRNIQKGVQDSLLAVARVEVGIQQGQIAEQYRIADDIADAVMGAWQMAQTGSTQGLSISQAIRRFGTQQLEMPGVTALVDGVSRDILDVLERAVSEPTVLSRFLTDYGDTVDAQAPDTEMMAMMGVELPTQEALIYQLKDRHLGDGEMDGVVSDLPMRDTGLSTDAEQTATQRAQTRFWQLDTPEGQSKFQEMLQARDTEALGVAQNWTDTEREAFIRELVDSGYYTGDWMNRMREAYERNHELAKAQFDADTPEAAIERWDGFVRENFIDHFDAQRKADLVRVELSERDKSFNVKDREVSGHREIAVISQALRDAGREHMTVFYVEETAEGGYRVRGHETTTLNAPGKVRAEAMRDIETRRVGYGGNTRIVFLHNHPSAAADFSDGDISADNRYRDYFGDGYLGFLVIDSGEYAMSWRHTDSDYGNRVYTRQTHIKLEADELGWDPEWNKTHSGSEGQQPQIRMNDPLFQGDENEYRMLDWRFSIGSSGTQSSGALRRTFSSSVKRCR